VQKKLPTDVFASLAEGLPWGHREVEARAHGHCVHPGSLDLPLNSMKKKVPMGYRKRLFLPLLLSIRVLHLRF
jgi:hypothetical protein